MAVEAVASIKTQAYIGVRSHIEEPFAFFRRFDVGSHVRMEDQVESEFICNFFGVGYNLPTCFHWWELSVGQPGS